ncbi:hypothetical protein PFICI_07618 [Pestalotiopsis fici W106-1]|uniref:Dipeptidylpeptidase IV N-terminal domain-containing protein n=1 Tax=Pestalotiopsis fici (strain W106-1 / CGMCC3.15140) TaxID=1229662 RepID=W3X243_PESFW|nr:uncharacterized protein PFICI_07618 [Pestalotiopsis fici W106-1]ETS80089.1 hypothetical protein PFICI_07618 [Pestalotiopsis fici W106-1]
MQAFKNLVWLGVASVSQASCLGHAGRAPNTNATLGTFLHNRISPNYSELYIADANGANEKLLLGSNTVFDFRANWSPDGNHVTFTSERRGDGQSDVYRVGINGSSTASSPELLVASEGVDDSAAISPDGKMLAFATSRFNQTSQIMLMVMETGDLKNLTLIDGIAGAANPTQPNGYFKPAWSPDGEWIVFTSDRNTPWRGHSDGAGWEHVQELSIYVARPNGTDFRLVSSRANYTQGSPRFSPDGKRLVFYEILTEDTYDARLQPSLLYGTVLNSSIVSVDFATGTDRIVHASGTGVRISPSYVTDDVMGYVLKEADSNGIYYASISGTNYTQYQTIPMNTMTPALRSPAWSPDGKYIIYEKQGPSGGSTSTSKEQHAELYSFDQDWDYRFTDVFPMGARSGCPMMVMSQQMEGPAINNLIRLNMDGDDQVTLYEPTEDTINPAISSGYNARAYQGNWGPNDTNITFGFGAYFVGRQSLPGFIYSIGADGSDLTLLAGNNISNYGFPSFSHDGSKVVFRTWPGTADNGTTVGTTGLAIVDVATRKVTQLTTEWDNLPAFSPDGSKILFTRRTNLANIGDNYDIFTMSPDGTDLTQVTDSVASDAHAVWTHDGRIAYSTAMFGFQQEAPLYDDSMQPYAIIMVMDADGSNKTPLTNSLWEDAMPMFAPAHTLASTC